VFPSSTDTFGNLILEAQVSGIAFVVNVLGGPQEGIFSESTGLVVEVHNADSLLCAMRRSIRSPVNMKRMGEAAGCYVGKRSFEKPFDETLGMHQAKHAEPECSLHEAI